MASNNNSPSGALSNLSDDSPSTQTFKPLARSTNGDQLANPAEAIAEAKQKTKKGKKKVEAPKYAWTMEAIEALIKEWETRPALVDCTHAQYHMKDKRKVALDQICQKLGSVHGISPVPTSDDLLKKMNSLRTYYNAKRNKEKASRSTGKGADEIYDSVWQYYESLQFLNDNVAPRSTHSNMRWLDQGAAPPLLIHDQEKRAPR